MKKLKLYIGMMVGLLATMLTACTSDLSEETVPSNSKGEMTLSFKVSTPDYKIGTRSEGYNNEGFESSDVQIFCFDANGYFLGMGQDLTVEATSKENIGEGTANTINKRISVKMPNATARLHIIANANINTEKAANEWIGLHENKLITTFESKADENQALTTKYWGYCSGSTTAEMKAKLTNNVIHLIRDRAKITADGETATNIHSVEISIGEGMKYATIAAFDRNKLEFPNTTAAKDWEWNINDITLPKSEERYKGSEGQMGTVQYCFEDENSSKNPVSCILKVTFNDKTEKWYKVYLQDKDQKFYKIKRNYTYAIHIQKLNPMLGYPGYYDALNGYAANNPWITVEDIIQEISDGTYTMNIVNGTYQMLTQESANSEQTIDFEYKGEASQTAADFNVSWTENKDFTKLEGGKLPEPTVQYNATTGKGTITYKIGDISAGECKTATIMLVDKKHGLTRNIHLYSISDVDFNFPPEITMGKEVTSEAQLTFKIPSYYPKELLPIEIEIASNDVNPIGSDVKVASTKEVDGGAGWNCWFVTKYEDQKVIGNTQTITMKNVRAVTGTTGTFYIKAKHYNKNKPWTVTINYQNQN